MVDITYHEFEDADLSESIVVVGFPTTGLVSTILTNFIVDNQELRRVGAFLSDNFAPVANIENGKPNPPITVFAGDNIGAPNHINKLVVVTSKSPAPKHTLSQLADTIIEWAEDKDATLITSIEGFQSEREFGENGSKRYHIANIDEAEQFTENLSTTELDHGTVGGISGLLLYKGDIKDYPVVTLIGEANKAYPDSRAASKLLEELNALIPGIEMDKEPLLKEAERIESKIKKAMSQMRKQQSQHETEPMALSYA